MSSVCAEQHKLLLSLKKYQSLRDNNIDDMIPPRKLLTREAFSSGDGYGDGDPYSSDHFRMFEFKIRRCTRSRSHDWTDCPFAHPGEKARRRDPRRFHYSGAVCPEYRRGNCTRGDACEFSHGVFECWLHPARYRTEACKDGKNCKRKVCFFAHSPRQLRVLPPDHNNNNNNNCCSFCQHCSNSSPSSTNCSPTSTLFGVSHFSYSSPPLSPSSPPSLNELISSLECLSYGEASSSPVYSASSKLPWLDVSDQHHYSLSPSPASSPLGCTQHQKQKRFNILSPLTTVNSSASFSNGKCYPSTRGKFSREENKVVVDDVTLSATSAPDLGWVNDLLM